MAILYRVTNKTNNKKYYGITSGTLSNRKKTHIHSAIKKQSPWKFHAAIRKYGKDNFIWEVVKEFPCIKSAGEEEVKLINEDNTVQNGYNMTDNIIFNAVGIKRSEETKQKMSAALKGRKKTEEHKKNISAGLQGHIPWNKGKTGVQKAWNKGIPRTDAEKQAISNARKKRG